MKCPTFYPDLQKSYETNECLQCRIQDFPRGCRPERERQLIIWQKLAKNCMKM